MSKLDALIAKLCPNGVPYKRFDEVCSLHARIGWQRLTKAEYKANGEYMLITGTDFTDNHEINYDSCVYVSEDRYLQDPKIQLENDDILITKDGTLGKVAQVHNLPKPATLNGGVFVVRCLDGSLDNRFILHYLLSIHFLKVVDQQKTGSTISHLTQGLFSRLSIPVPPIEVQHEIVRILDNFSELTAKLTVELTAELTARKKQYEYYRENLIYKDGKIKKVSLGELCEVVVGGEAPADCVKGNTSDSMHPYAVWGNGRDVYGYAANYTIESDSVCISSIGANTGAVFFHRGKFTPIIRLKVLVPKVEYIDSRYLFHAVSTVDFAPKKSSVPNMSAADIKKVLIPLPTLQRQKQVSTILDRFAALCNDITKRLPAEIEARQTQYEYYRDQLLTFKEA